MPRDRRGTRQRLRRNRSSRLARPAMLVPGQRVVIRGGDIGGQRGGVKSGDRGRGQRGDDRGAGGSGMLIGRGQWVVESQLAVYVRGV